MIVALMQPYFFPYIGYFQLMAACDLFVVRDDVQFIAGGWVNRNRILVDGKARWISMPVVRASHQLPIARRRYALNHPAAARIRRRIEAAYRQAPHFEETIAIVDHVLACDDSNVATFNTRLVMLIAERLGIHTPVRRGTDIGGIGVTGEARVIEICVSVGASDYVNPLGGAHLYDPERFSEAGLSLRFLRPWTPLYPQFEAAPVAALSIIDVLMFNDAARTAEMLHGYTLVAGTSHAVDRAVPNEDGTS
jgi:hypothetical protein